MVLLGTAGIILASENPNPPPPRAPCEPESVTLRADSTCGAPTDLTVSTTEICGVTVAGGELAGLPAESPDYFQTEVDAGLRAGFELEGVVADGGPQRSCSARPADGGGFTIDCLWNEACDGGPDATVPQDCGVTCSGTLLLRE